MSEIPPAHEHLETAEHAAHAAAEGGLRAAIVPLSIAAMAVVAGALGGLETTASSNAIIARSDASIRRNEASDLWSQYQAESLKKHLYGLAAAQPRADSASLTAQVDKYAAEEVTLQAQAKAKEQETQDQVAVSEKAMEQHHRLSYATSIVQLAIALASISIVIRRRWLWYGSLACLAVGVVVAAT
jgi:Domain of unknown function (DUF4337)